MNPKGNCGYESLNTPTLEHCDFLQDNTPYQEHLDQFLDTEVNLLTFPSQSSLDWPLTCDRLTPEELIPSPTNSLPLSPVSSPSPTSQILPPSPCDSTSTEAAEDPPYFIPSPITSPSPITTLPPSPKRTIDYLLANPDNSGIPPWLEEFLSSKTEGSEFHSSTNTDSQSASHSPEPYSPTASIDPIPTPLPVLSGTEVEAELDTLPSENLFTPPNNTVEDTPNSPISQSRNTEFERLGQPIPPSIFHIKVVPTAGLLKLLQTKRKRSKRFRRSRK